jgi:hypothetical protein
LAGALANFAFLAARAGFSAGWSPAGEEAKGPANRGNVYNLMDALRASIKSRSA